MTHRFSGSLQRIREIERPVIRFFLEGGWAKRDPTDPENCDFVAANPQEMVLPEFLESLQRWTVPQDKDWYGDKLNEPYACEAVAAGLRERRGVPFVSEDVLVTDGAFTGMTVCLRAVTNPGEEVIYLTPSWFFFAAIIASGEAEPVAVPVDQRTWDLDLAAIEAAIGERTSAIVVNSPHNPSGKIYPPETLEALAEILTRASERAGRPIYLISDETFSRIVFDDRPFSSPTAFYPYSFVVYTYTKQLLTPSQRCGFVALPPTMPDRESMREALLLSLLTYGSHGTASNVLQRAIPDLERITVDVKALQRRRDRLVAALDAFGYEVHSPEATFYLLPTSPDPDDEAFVERLAAEKVFVMPGTVVEAPGRVRISITASDDMVDRALPVFEAAARR
jgi:aspartate aminotransferase